MEKKDCALTAGFLATQRTALDSHFLSDPLFLSPFSLHPLPFLSLSLSPLYSQPSFSLTFPSLVPQCTLLVQLVFRQFSTPGLTVRFRSFVFPPFLFISAPTSQSILTFQPNWAGVISSCKILLYIQTFLNIHSWQLAETQYNYSIFLPLSPFLLQMCLGPVLNPRIYLTQMPFMKCVKGESRKARETKMNYSKLQQSGRQWFIEKAEGEKRRERWEGSMEKGEKCRVKQASEAHADRDARRTKGMRIWDKEEHSANLQGLNHSRFLKLSLY